MLTPSANFQFEGRLVLLNVKEKEVLFLWACLGQEDLWLRKVTVTDLRARLYLSSLRRPPRDSGGTPRTLRSLH